MEVNEEVVDVDGDTGTGLDGGRNGVGPGSQGKGAGTKIIQPESVIRMGKTKSPVWDFFFFKPVEGSENVPDKKQVFCKVCENVSGVTPRKKASIPYSGGTTNLTNHLKIHHPKEFDSIQTDKTKKEDAKPNGIKNYFGADKKKQYKWPKSSGKWKDLTMSIAKWFCSDTRPSEMVEDKGFIKVMEIAAPEYDMPCAKTITSYVKKLYDDKKKEVIKELEGAEDVAVTTDGGTSSNADSYHTTNAHYIDENIELKYHCLGVRKNKEKHSAENYRAKTDDICEEFNIKEKTFAHVTDNEPKMRKAFEDDERNGCISHIIHSSVSKGMKEVYEVETTVEKVRKVTTRHNKSYAFKYGLEAEQKKMGITEKPLTQDVPNRWGSTRKATQSFLDDEKDIKDLSDEEEEDNDVYGDLPKFKNADAINRALRNLTWKKKSDMYNYLLSTSDMIRIKELNSFLTKLDVYSTTLGGARFVSSSVVLPVVKSIKKLLEPEDSDAEFIKELKAVILEDFKVRIGENLNYSMLVKATALDPRFSRLKVLEDKAKREDVFTELMAEAKTKSEQPKKVDTTKEPDKPTKRRKLGLDFDESDEEDNDPVDEIKREFERYRSEEVLSRDEDPLDWWRARKERYPTLIRLVRKYLAIPATSTQAERIFSALGWLLNKRRLCMTGENVNAQLFLKDNLKSDD